MTELCPTCHQPLKRPDLDGRAVQWRIRTRLYLATQTDEPIADSDPDTPPDKSGNTVLTGLPAVAAEVSALAVAYHDAVCDGLEYPTLLHKLKGLRPTLSRRKGNAVWRLHYSVKGHEMLARVDIERVDA
jgi:hypothetical protein